MTGWTDTAAEIERILLAAGFVPMSEYTSADSLLHRGEYLGFYGLKGYEAVDEAVSHDGVKVYTELVCDVQLRLMGKAGSYDDREELDEKCESVSKELEKSGVLLVRGAKLGSAVQSLPLHRLERQLDLKVGICAEVDIGE